MEQHGLEVRPEYIATVGTRIESAYAGMKEYLQNNPELPTAFVADNDIIAIGAMRALKEEGYNIEATPNKGYVLLENSDVLSKQGIAYYLTEEIDIFSYKTIDSTNTQMKKLAINGGKNHSVIVSEEQSAGRGRFGRSFYSPAQKGVYMSVLLKTGDSLQNATMITIKTAVAVRRAIAKLYDIEVAIKWVNDLYYRGKKVCGILSEAISDFESGMIEAIIIGIGINVSTDNFPLEIASIATSLGLQEANRNQFIAEILNQLFAIIDEDFKLVLNEYRMASCVLHKQITFNQKGEQFTGLVREINDLGNLVVSSNGAEMVLTAGEVSIIGGNHGAE